MAVATAITFSKFKVELGDGGTPEVFLAPCGFNARSLNQTKNLTEVDLPDCADEDAPAWVARDVRSLDWGVSGEGVLAQESVEVWNEFFNSNLSRTVKITQQFPVTLVTKTGKAHLSTFTQGVNRGERATITVELAGDGELVTVVTP